MEFLLQIRERERERNVLFNDALNTFYLRLYGVRHMVKDHSDSEKGNPLPAHRLLLSINSKVFFIYAPSHRQDNPYHGLCYTSCGALTGTRKIAQFLQISARDVTCGKFQQCYGKGSEALPTYDAGAVVAVLL